MTEPYHHSEIYVDNLIYNNNLSLIKELHFKQIRTVHILECNNILRKSNLTKNGRKLNKSGKWHLSRALVNNIEQGMEKLKQDEKNSCISNFSGEDKCQTLANSRCSPKQVREKRNRLSIAEEFSRSQEDSTETIKNITDANDSVPVDNTNTFLYPRLSQLQLTLD